MHFTTFYLIKNIFHWKNRRNSEEKEIVFSFSNKKMLKWFVFAVIFTQILLGHYCIEDGQCEQGKCSESGENNILGGKKLFIVNLFKIFSNFSNIVGKIVYC